MDDDEEGYVDVSFSECIGVREYIKRHLPETLKSREKQGRVTHRVGVGGA